MTIRFDHAASGLISNGPARGFCIAGEDRVFHPADAVLDGDKVIVSSPQVAAPVAVRYAWRGDPESNLRGINGLPALPFRTDDWPGVTDDVR
jgi:sialate O-acetylesterase